MSEAQAQAGGCTNNEVPPPGFRAPVKPRSARQPPASCPLGGWGKLHSVLSELLVVTLGERVDAFWQHFSWHIAAVSARGLQRQQ